MKAIAIQTDPRARSVRFDDGTTMTVVLADGRSITVPLQWSPRLRRATPAERAQYDILEDGRLLRWDAVDEDIEVAALLSTGTVLVPPDGDLTGAPGPATQHPTA
jgi:hypothetical protein